MEAHVGLDVHSKRSVFVIEAEDGRVVARGDIPTTPEGFRRLRRQHEPTAETPVALETGTVAFYAARELARVGLRPIVIDAHEVRVKAHRPQQKSDRGAVTPPRPRPAGSPREVSGPSGDASYVPTSGWGHLVCRAATSRDRVVRRNRMSPKRISGQWPPACNRHGHAPEC